MMTPRAVLFFSSKRCRLMYRNSRLATSVSTPAGGGEPAETTTGEDEVSLDISRMNSWHRDIFHGACPPPDWFKWQKELGAMRRRFGMYGLKSQVDPSLLWPTPDELEQLKHEDACWRPDYEATVQAEMEEEKAEREKREARIKEVEANVMKYGKEVKSFREKWAAKQAEELKAKQETEKKIRKIQQHFGYAIEPSHPKFVEFMEKNRAEELKAARLARKKAYEAKLLAQTGITTITR